MKKKLPKFQLLIANPLGGRRIQSKAIIPEKEIIPPWKNMGRKNEFEGYTTLFHALTISSTLDSIGIIVKLGKDVTIGTTSEFYTKYRVYSTNIEKHYFDESKVLVSLAPNIYPYGVYDIRLTHVYKRKKRSDWAERVKNKNSIALDEYKQIMMDFMDLQRDEIHTIENNKFTALMSSRSGIPTDLEKVAFFSDLRVNFNQHEQKKGTKGQTYSINIDKACRNLPFSEEPKVHISITENAFDQVSEILFMSTIVHEAMHALTSYRVIYLINLWKKSNTKKSFFSWIVPLSISNNNKDITKTDLVHVLRKCGFALREYKGRTSAEYAKYLSDSRKTLENPFSVQEMRELNPILKIFGVNKNSRPPFFPELHFYPHLEGFSLKMWLIDKSIIIKDVNVFSNDLEMMNIFYEKNKFHLGNKPEGLTQLIAKNVASRVSNILRSIEPEKRDVAFRYISNKNEPGNFFEILNYINQF